MSFKQLFKSDKLISKVTGVKGKSGVYVLEFVNGTALYIAVTTKIDTIGDKEMALCEMNFDTILYKMGEVDLITPVLSTTQKRLLQNDCEQVYIIR